MNADEFNRMIRPIIEGYRNGRAIESSEAKLWFDKLVDYDATAMISSLDEFFLEWRGLYPPTIKDFLQHFEQEMAENRDYAERVEGLDAAPAYPKAALIRARSREDSSVWWGWLDRNRSADTLYLWRRVPSGGWCLRAAFSPNSFECRVEGEAPPSWLTMHKTYYPQGEWPENLQRLMERRDHE